jgi:hypothetical protein
MMLHTVLVLFRLSGRWSVIRRAMPVSGVPLPSDNTLMSLEAMPTIWRMGRRKHFTARKGAETRVPTMTSRYISLGDFHKEVKPNCYQANQTSYCIITGPLIEGLLHTYWCLKPSARVTPSLSDSILKLSYLLVYGGWLCFASCNFNYGLCQNTIPSKILADFGLKRQISFLGQTLVQD